MDITFSRHARRRMALYGISEDDVTWVLDRKAGHSLLEGRAEVVDNVLVGKYGYPLKVVYNQEQDKLTVITVYPLKKDRPRQ